MKRYCYGLLLLCAACVTEPDIRSGEVLAYVPVYASQQAINDLGMAPPRATASAGKIYAYNQYLFQIEQAKGIHIIDNTNPAQARKVGFLKVPLCSEIAIRGGYLYTNHVDDLVVFNLSAPEPQLVQRLEGAFPQVDQKYPPFSNTYFECPDAAKGIVVGWEQKMIKTPSCRR